MLNMNGNHTPNRLISEKSPYLLQHARNPVDWYPWCDEAFEKAAREHKPIFLSIGYAACHWCHVMAHESFEDEEVARLMNETFVCVKVDREERPDIDSVYMKVCQMMTGSGGWPLTILMTTDKKPFFAATYLPKENRFGMIGLIELIPKMKEAWEKRHEEVCANAGKIIDALTQTSTTHEGEAFDEGSLELGYTMLEALFDETYGGFGGPPKFPQPNHQMFLLRYWKRTGESKALAMVEKTLQNMMRGGIHDHLGGGFHRYSVDSSWLLPHFEKMLYDQALLAMIYTEAFQATRKEEYRLVAGDILDFALREMTSPEGGFYSSLDADSEGEEGKFYIWSEDEVTHILRREADIFITSFGVEGEKAVLHLIDPLREIAAGLGIAQSELVGRLDGARKKLFEARERRIHPATDTKVLTDWNGLMIAAFAKGGSVLNESTYVQAAHKAHDFIMRHMTRDGRLFHAFEGISPIPGFLDDYAFFIWGLIELYETTFMPSFLEEALALNETLCEHFWDEKNGGFFFTSDDGEQLLLREEWIHDGAIPSGNSVAMLNLLKLARFTADSKLEEKALHIARVFSDMVLQSPHAHTQFLCALDFALGPTSEVVIVGDPQREDTKSMIRSLEKEFIPHKVVLFVDETSPEMGNRAEYTKEMKSIDGKATAYVCRHFSCNKPTTDVGELMRLVNEKG